MRLIAGIEKRISLIVILLYHLTVLANGQVVISSGSGWRAFETINLSTIVEDKDSHEAIVGASAYLQADTVITHFTMSLENGVIRFSDVPKGKYRLNVEMLGYLPYRKEVSVTKADNIPDIIELQADTLLLEGATITGFTTPVYQVRDTLIYNAISVQVGNNALLEDLVQKMPGMEISNGKVSVNGVPVKTITVDGRTFFFDDPSIALKNIPARIVERIRVFDKLSLDSGSVVASLGKKEEKVMDIELKEEFRKGTFGNAIISGGEGTTRSANEKDSALKALYDTKLVSSSYNEKDQIVVLATAHNRTPAEGWSGVLAMNTNTSRIANSDNTLAIIASYDKKIEDRLLSSTYYAKETGFSHSIEEVNGNAGIAKLDINLETKIRGDWGLTITPLFNYTRGNYIHDNSKSFYSGNSNFISHLGQSGEDTSLIGGLSIQGGRGSLKRTGRSLQFKMSGSGTASGGVKKEISSLSLDYITTKRLWIATASAMYAEPLSEMVALNITGDFSYSITNNIITATNAETKAIATSFSSYSFAKRLNSSEAIFLTWNQKKYAASFGGQIRQDMSDNTWDVDGSHNIKWLFTLSPFINIESSNGSWQLFMSSHSVTPQDIQLSPSLSRTSSAERLIGNPYTKPSTYFSATANYYKTRQIQVMCEFRLDRHPIVHANWLSPEGIRYSFPVNSTRPQITVSPFINYYVYFTKDKRCYLYYNINGVMRFERGYQATVGPIIDEKIFDFADFIEKCWGDDNGDIFYDGLSGFNESRTITCNMNSLLDFTYRNKIMTATFHVSPTYYLSHYSMVPEAGEKVWTIELGPSIDLRLPKEFVLSSGLEYVLYKGYGTGLDRGLWNLSFEINKEIGTIAFTLKCNDALNQTVTIMHSASSEYVQNIMQNRLGRTLLVSVGYLFGKGSAEMQRNSSKFVRNVTR